MTETTTTPPAGPPPLVKLPPEMAALYALPPEVPVCLEDPFDGTGGVSLPRVARGIATTLADRPEGHDERLVRFHAAWPAIESLERYLGVGNSAFAKTVANGLLATHPELPVAHFGRGAARAARADWDGAALDFAAARRLAPGSRRPLPELYLALALGERFDEARRLGDELNATPEGRRVAHLFGPGVDAADVAGLGRLVTALGGLSRARASGDREALADAARALYAEFPDEPGALVPAAEALRDAGERAPARALAERITRMAPGRSPGWLLLGGLALEAGDRVEAERAGLRARAVAPDEPAAVALLARVLRADGRPAEAARLLEAALERTPDDPQLSALLAGALLEAHDFERAVDRLESESRRHSWDPTAWFNLGRAREAAGRLEAAAEAYTEAIRRAPRFAEGIEALAHCRARMGRDDEARGLLDRLVADLPGSPFGWRGLGDLLLSTNLGEAARAYARAIELRPDLPLAGSLYIAALEASRSGKPDRALRLFEDAVRTDPRRHEAWCGLGAALFAAGNGPAAERAFTEAIRLNDRVPGYRRNLAAVYRARFRANPLRHWRCRGRAVREEREADLLARAPGTGS